MKLTITNLHIAQGKRKGSATFLSGRAAVTAEMKIMLDNMIAATENAEDKALMVEVGFSGWANIVGDDEKVMEALPSRGAAVAEVELWLRPKLDEQKDGTLEATFEVLKVTSWRRPNGETDGGRIKRYVAPVVADPAADLAAGAGTAAPAAGVGAEDAPF